MGGNHSTLPQVGENFPYFTLTFREFDKIILALADQNVISVVRQAIAVHWKSGVQSDGYDSGGAYEIKFHGYPFNKATSRESTIQVKKICCKILADLHAMGWTLMVASDMSRYGDLTTWFFRRMDTERKPTSIICVSLSSYDSLQLINAPDALKPVFQEAVATGYGQIQEQKTCGEDIELKLSGYPWSTAEFGEGIRARRTLLSIFRAFDRSGYQFYGTANLKGTADSIFFIYNESYPHGEYQYSMMSLNRNDRIRLIDCTKQVVETVRDTIVRNWTLQEASDRGVAWEFKLKGFLWASNGSDAVSSRLVITLIFQNLAQQGWCVVSSLDISRRLNDKGVFVLRTCQPASLSHFCISLNQTSKIRLINAPQNLHPLMGQIIRQFWPQGVRQECEYYGSHELKLNGNPWAGRGAACFGGNEYLAARCLMCFLLQALMDNGWRVICSADVSSKYHHGSNNSKSYPLDVHSWFVVYVGGASATAPPVEAPTNPAAPNVAPFYDSIEQHDTIPVKPPPPYEDLHKP